MASITENYNTGKWIFYTVTDNGTDYKTHCRVGKLPSVDDAVLYIRKKEYPDATGSTLAEIEAWIAANPTVDPLPWTSTHPKEAGTEYQADLSSYQGSPLYNKTQAQIDSYIDSMSTVAQLRGALKEITKVMKIMMHDIEG